jgi:tetratricopeptide (TPR) repeat protein
LTPAGYAEEVGLATERLGARHVAFLLLVVLDARRGLASPIVAGKVRPQRQRFGDYLGMSEGSLRRWAARNLAPVPGVILRWNRRPLEGHQPSRTGGPWWIAAKDPLILPNADVALKYVDDQRTLSEERRLDPSALWQEALRHEQLSDFDESLDLLQEALVVFARRRWSRRNPLWFEIRLSLAHAQMQLGRAGVVPRTAYNTLISVGKLHLVGKEAAIIRARALHIAALVHNQRNDEPGVMAALRDLQSGDDALRGVRDEAAVLELWKMRAYEELTRVRVTGSAKSKHQSAILQVGGMIQDRREEFRMRYGESLLRAKRPATALEYIRPALASGQLSKPAWVIAERLSAVAKWASGGSAGEALEHLEQAKAHAKDLGFAHQIQEIRLAAALIRRAERAKKIR